MASKKARKDDEIPEVPEVTYDSDEEGGVRIDDDIYIPPPPRARETQSGNHPRLIISKIVNENFKSYADRVEIGPFHVCFSAIVGPNGSGKSNLIDSMLFVFGYRATKIRSNKLSSLIHSSMEHPNCASCKVSVHFRKILDQQDGEYKEIPSSEVIVSRTAFKDNSSFYELNSRRVQFKEIARFLRNEGVDLDYNRFLILQGEVEQIALMKPKAQNDNDPGMLEFLEDIIGTSRYKVPLEKLFEKIEDLNERVTEKTNRLKIAEKDRDTLKEPMQEAVAYLKHENAITKMEHKLYHCKKTAKLAEVKEKEAVHKELENDCNELAEEMAIVKAQKDELQQELKAKCKKWDSVQQQKDAVSSEFEKLTKKDENLHAELVETNKRRKANAVTIQEERSKLELLAKVPEKNAVDIEECEKLIEKHVAHKKKEDEALEELMGTLKEKTEPLMKTRAKLEKELIDFRKHVNEAKAAFDLAQSELEIYTSVEEKEKAKLDKLKETLQNAAETLRDRKEQLESFKKKIPRTEKTLTETKAELAQVKSDELEAATKLRDMRRQFEEQRSAMNASKSRSKVLDSLMQQKREGKLPGVIGRLGDLGAVDSKYDVAISTACGGLDSIVVDTVDTAQSCIEYLRQYNVGRAQFIPLEKQQHLIEAYKRKVNTPENVIRLFDVIKVNDESILPAFYYGLRNTLLADNLEQGSRIAYGAERWRVVTLQGQLIETSGTMSGGGQPLKGRIGQKVVRNEPTTRDVEKLQGDLDEVYERCNRLKAKQPQLEEQIKALSTGLQEMLLNRDKFEIEVTGIQEQAPSLKQQLKAQEKKVAESKSSPERVQELTKAVQKAEKAFKKTEENSQSTEVAVQEINDKIEEVTGNRVKEQQKKIADLTKAIDKARKEIVRLQVGIKTSERDTQKTSQRIEQLEGDIETCKARIIAIKSEQAELEEVAKGLQTQLKEFDEALKERDQAGAALKEQITKIQARENKMKATKIDLDLKAQTSAKELKDLNHKISQYERGIQGLKLNEIPGEPIAELSEYTEEQISNFDARTLANNLAAAKESLPKEIPNMQTIKEYLQKDAVFLQRSEEVAVVTGERNKMRGSYDSARQRRAEEFRGGFDVITTKLKEMYQMITLGGAAELEPVDSLDPFTEGITFSVRPPKKSWKNISNLSGGEKTLSSLALVFALHHYKPTPLYFMDEIDAALDFKNVSIVGRYIKDRTKNAQFIVISLRSEMFELADQLVGIYKTFNATKNVVVDMKQFYKTHPQLAEKEQARFAEKQAFSGRCAFSQPAKTDRSSGGTGGAFLGGLRVPLTCPPLREMDDKDQIQASGILDVSMSSPPHSPKTRKQSQSLGGDTPITTRRSTK